VVWTKDGYYGETGFIRTKIDVTSTTVDSGVPYTDEYMNDKLHANAQGVDGDYTKQAHTHEMHHPHHPGHIDSLSVAEEEHDIELRRRVDSGWVESHPSVNLGNTLARPDYDVTNTNTPTAGRYQQQQRATAPSYNTGTGTGTDTDLDAGQYHDRV
jgi:hypothetical protein